MADNVVILAGGQGKRMKTTKPKALLEVLGDAMLEWVISACEEADLSRICIVKGYEAQQIDDYLGGRYTTVMQSERLGTGHAVMQAKQFLSENIDGYTLILNGDAPFIDCGTIKGALKLHKSSKASVTVVTSVLEDATGYGRIIRGENGVSAIVEHKDCTEEQRKIREINSGCYWFDTKELLSVLDEIKPDNAQGEYYLTDCLSLLLAKGKTAQAYISENPYVSLGANDRTQLLELNTLARNNIIKKHLENGVEFSCTDGVIIGRNVKIGGGTHIKSGTQLFGNTTIGSGCVIGCNTVLKNVTVGDFVTLNNVQAADSQVEDYSTVGPWVQLRPGTHIKKHVKIGDFVEIKNSVIGNRASMAHLSYVGDSDVGENVNMGGGCITCNFDGENKYRTVIGDNAFIGCNTNLVAPVKVGEGAYTAAGSTITKDVPDGALAIERSQTAVKEGYADKKLAKRNEKFAKMAQEQQGESGKKES